MGIFRRGSVLWIRFRDLEGKWKSATTGYAVGQEELAQAMLDHVLDRVRKATAGEVIALDPMTVRAYVERWLVERGKLDLDWKADRARLAHVLPKIGNLRIADVRARHIVEAMMHVRTTPSERTGENVSPRTVHRIYEVLCALFRDAKLADLIEQTPCILDERHLGPLVDSDPEWRARAIFERDEAVELISTPKIPDDRRLLYGCMLLAGMRPGEASALRWHHYDPTVKPLGRMIVAASYDSRRHREKGTKTDATRHVPVHPTLAAMLAEWKLHGWEAMMGRERKPDDLILPLPPADAAARRAREGEPFRTEPYNGKRWREVDAPLLGWRYREMYAMKSTFITLVLDDGADPHVIESRVTHTKRSRSAFDGYNRGRQWEITCAEVAKLKIARQADAIAAVAGAEPIALVTDLVTSAVLERDDSSSGLRRRVSNAPKSALHVIRGAESREVDTPRGAPNASLDHDAVTSLVTLAAELATAVIEGDERRARDLAREVRSLLGCRRGRA